MEKLYKAGSGKLVLFCFVAFFGIIIAVNSGFIYMAMKSNTGVVTENAYEKGLAYNKVLAEAKAQPSLQDQVTYEGGVLRWVLKDEAGKPVSAARTSVTLVRPVKDGYDFSLTLKEITPGTYEARPDFSMQGLWTARLNAQWNDKQYQTTQDLIAR